MARICAVTGKKTLSGNKRSHSLRATKRKWKANLHKTQIEVDGKMQTVNVSARGLRTLNKGM